MTRRLSKSSRTTLGAACLLLACTGHAQARDPAAAGPGDAAAENENARIESCFAVPTVTDMNVLDDAHVYVRTRGGNHYLVTTEQCRNLERSDRVGGTRFVPYGRTVCQADGSYLAYDAGGRESVCPILTIDRVESRRDARAIADERRPQVEIEAVAPSERAR